MRRETEKGKKEIKLEKVNREGRNWSEEGKEQRRQRGRAKRKAERER